MALGRRIPRLALKAPLRATLDAQTLRLSTPNHPATSRISSGRSGPAIDEPWRPHTDSPSALENRSRRTQLPPRSTRRMPNKRSHQRLRERYRSETCEQVITASCYELTHAVFQAVCTRLSRTVAKALDFLSVWAFARNERARVCHARPRPRRRRLPNLLRHSPASLPAPTRSNCLRAGSPRKALLFAAAPRETRATLVATGPWRPDTPALRPPPTDRSCGCLYW